MSKRTIDDISDDVPEGFKIKKMGKRSNVVYDKYVKLVVQNVKIGEVYATDTNDNVKVYVHEDELSPGENVWINEVDSSLRKYAEENNYTHCPLKNPDTKLIKFTPLRKGYSNAEGEVIKQGDTPYSKRKKSDMKNYPHEMTGIFMLSSVYKYKPPESENTMYGVNLIVPGSAKAVKISTIKNKENKKDDKDIAENNTEKEDDNED